MKALHTHSTAIIIRGDSLKGGGGAERRFIRLWKYFNLKSSSVHLVLNDSLFVSGCECGLFVENDKAKKTLHIVEDGCFLSLSFRIYKTIVENNFDLVHLVLAQKVLTPLYLLLSLKKKIVITHTIAFSWFSSKGHIPLLTKLLSRLLWKIADRIDSLYSGFIPHYAKPLGFEAKVEVSPCSFSDIDKFRVTGTKEPLIVFAGRLIPEKSPMLFIDALTILRETPIQWSAIMAGDGPLRESVEQRIIMEKLEKYITVGSYSDMSALFSKSTIFVSLQETENYPSQSLLEAMLASNVVIATNVGETSRIVRDGETGFLINHDAKELSDKMLLILSEISMAKKLAHNGRSLIEKEHTIEHFASYIENFWQKAYEEKYKLCVE